MTNIKIPIHRRNLEVRKRALRTWKISREDKTDLLRFLQEMELGKVNLGRRISEVRQLKYLDILKVPLEYFGRPTSRLTLKDVESFEKDLASNRILSFKDEPFAQSTKADLRRLLKTYLKWKLGDTEKFRKLCGWFDTRQIAKTPDYLKEEQISAIYKSGRSAAERFLVAVLFDSGARAEEFHNIRYEDIQLPEGQDNYVRVTLKEEYSKTKGRVIRLYWKQSLEAVRDYIKQREAEGVTPQDPVYNKSYENSRKSLNRLGQKVLKRALHYHLFRHSSATYYATKMNRQQLCYRYGWKFSSDMPDIYISRSGMENKDLDEKFAGTEIEALRQQLVRREQDVAMLKEWKKQVESTLALNKVPSQGMTETLKNPNSLRNLAMDIARQGHAGKFTKHKLHPTL